MTQRPQFSLDDVVTISVRIDGDPVPDGFMVERVETDVTANRIPVATIVLADGNSVTETFGLSDTDLFEPGRPVTVEAGYGSLNREVFTGLVTSQRIRVASSGKTSYVVTCHDPAIRTTIVPMNAQFLGQADSAILADLLKSVGLDSDIPDTSVVHEQVVMLNTTIWDFILARARRLGRLVLVDNGVVQVVEPEYRPALLTILFGESVLKIDADIDATQQVASVTARAWDPGTQDDVEARADEPKTSTQGGLSGPDLADALKLPALETASVRPLSAEELSAWADATLWAVRMARIQGRVTIPGNALAKVGTQFVLMGVGTQFNGEAYISGVRHRVVAGDWTTELTFGLPPVAPRTKAGRVAQDLRIAKVLKTDDDPLGQNRVQVRLRDMTETAGGIWVRVLKPYAGEGTGFTFLPEVGDEVVLAFLDDDPDAAILLGALNSSARPDPLVATPENNAKGIVSRSGLRFEFDDENAVLSLATPAGQSVRIDDAAKSLALADASGNRIEMTESGITITTKGDLSITADGKITLTAKDALSAEAKGDATLKGMNAAVAGQSSVSVKGGQSAELSSSGQTVVKGTMVMIN